MGPAAIYGVNALKFFISENACYSSDHLLQQDLKYASLERNVNSDQTEKNSMIKRKFKNRKRNEQHCQSSIGLGFLRTKSQL